jgi:hypothetical protein
MESMKRKEKNMKRKVLGERGQALILIALAAIGLVAITALAIDGSAKYSDRRHAQNAADASALAASLKKTDLLTGGATESDCSTATGYTNTTFCLDVIDAAWDRATENGYDGLLSNDVDVYSPPISGPYASNHNYVQVIITSRVNTFFARILGVTQTRNIVEAVALAKDGGYLGDGAMIISYDPDPNCSSGLGSGGGSVDISGSSTIELDGGGIFLNSDETCGFYIPNCADLQISTGSGINSVYGGDNINQEGCAEQADEFPSQEAVDIPNDVEFPDEPPECGITPAAPTYLGVNTSDNKGEWLIYPGYYTTFPHGLLVSNKQHIFMSSGVYCIDPGGPSHDTDLSWSPVDFVELNGSTDPVYNPKYYMYNPDGVTLYIKSGGGFKLNANNPTYLDASTTGDYQGYLIILEGNQSSIESCSISGGSDLDINGLIFAPYCNITVNGDSGTQSTINAQLIGWDLKINGGAGIYFQYNPDNQVVIHRKVGLMR